MATYMYVSVSAEDRIALFEVEPETGRLEHRGDEAVSGGPYPLAVDPHRRYLYAGRVDAREVSSYRDRWSARDGSPQIGSVAVDEEPCFLSTDRTGRYLLSAYYHAGMVGVHPIGENGAAAGPARRMARSPGPGRTARLTDRSNRFAYAPSIAGDFGPNLIFQFRFDESTGRLSPNSPPKLSPEGKAGPRHYCFHPEPGRRLLLERAGLQRDGVQPGRLHGRARRPADGPHPTGRLRRGELLLADPDIAVGEVSVRPQPGARQRRRLFHRRHGYAHAHPDSRDTTDAEGLEPRSRRPLPVRGRRGVRPDRLVPRRPGVRDA